MDTRLPHVNTRQPGTGNPSPGNAFDSWNDYLGLFSLLSGGLRSSEPQGKAKSWAPLPPAPAEPWAGQQVEDRDRGQRGCGFCRSNREAASLYSTHRLKGADGLIQCPVLRGYTCPLCGANGDRAHTVRYCPQRPHRLGTRTGHPNPRKGRC
ncbi:nanos homolog 1 [Ascaphus truei]|uniref:nanos homolog 1 n=1 Tax=Ascaphus truei TaxID=8439 RepID=UPI003F5A7AA1